MPDVPEPQTLLPGLEAMLKHLSRSGMQFLPTADPETVRQWMLHLKPAETSVPGAQAAASTSAPSTRAAPANRATPAAAPAATRLAPAPSGQPVGSPPPSPYSTTALPIEQRASELAQVAAEIADCRRCEVLACSRTHTVPGEGHPAARVCFMGEAPGADEDATGRPFVGRAGQLLTKMIEACGFSREEVYILNTIKCRPPGNRNPEPGEIENCRSYLERQLEIIQPEYIVCLGLISAQALLHTKLSVGRLRGQFHHYRGSKVLVTYHPSYLLREPEVKKAAWADLQFLLRDMGIEISKK